MKVDKLLQLDDSLLDEVKRSAKEDERSVNAQIRYLLKQALEAPKK